MFTLLCLQNRPTAYSDPSSQYPVDPGGGGYATPPPPHMTPPNSLQRLPQEEYDEQGMPIPRPNR